MSNNGTLSFDAVDYVIVLKGRLVNVFEITTKCYPGAKRGPNI